MGGWKRRRGDIHYIIEHLFIKELLYVRCMLSTRDANMNRAKELSSKSHSLVRMIIKPTCI